MKQDQLFVAEEEIQDLAFSNLEKFSYVGTAENFVEGRDIVLNALGIPRPEENTKVNVTPKRPKVKELSASTQELLQELTKMEQPVYDLVLKNTVSANLKKRQPIDNKESVLSRVSKKLKPY